MEAVGGARRKNRLTGWRGGARALPCLLAVCGFVLPAQTAEPLSDYQVKAAFLLNFTKFIEWPTEAFEDAASPLAICVLGEDPFDGTLDQLVAGEMVDGRKLVVKRMKKPPALKACQVLFVSSAERDVSSIVSGLGPGVLTVGDSSQFLREGGIITFVVSDRRVHFDISQPAASRARLTLSARLLGVARFVQR
jgi:hypothetical protein